MSDRRERGRPVCLLRPVGQQNLLLVPHLTEHHLDLVHGLFADVQSDFQLIRFNPSSIP